jgi:hypothetical protein
LEFELELGTDGKTLEANLLSLARQYEKKYFPELKPIASTEFINALDGPSRVLPEIDRIEVNQRLAIPEAVPLSDHA